MLVQCTNALPPNPFSQIDNLIHVMKDLDAIPLEALKPHRCVQIRMYNVPPGPGLGDSFESMEYWKGRKDMTMKTLIPWKIEPDNVASNAALLKILKSEIEPSSANPKWLLADINIFTRALRVPPS